MIIFLVGPPCNDQLLWLARFDAKTQLFDSSPLLPLNYGYPIISSRWHSQQYWVSTVSPLHLYNRKLSTWMHILIMLMAGCRIWSRISSSTSSLSLVVNCGFWLRVHESLQLQDLSTILEIEIVSNQPRVSLIGGCKAVPKGTQSGNKHGSIFLL